MNVTVLSGRLTRDPEQKEKVTKFQLAVDRQFKGKDGQKETDFISCVAFGKLGEIVGQYAHKGILVEVSGRIQTGSYKNKEDKTVYTFDVVCDTFKMLEKKNSNTTPADNGFDAEPMDSSDIPF